MNDWNPAAGTTRRTVVRTAAWAAPAVALTSVAPAFAESPAVECVEGELIVPTARSWSYVGALRTDELEDGYSGWLPVVGGGEGHAQGDHTNTTITDGFTGGCDNGQTTPTVVTISFTYPVAPGATYSLATAVKVSPAFTNPGGTGRKNIVAQVHNSAGTTEWLRIARRTWGGVEPSDQAMIDAGYTLQGDWDGDLEQPPCTSTSPTAARTQHPSAARAGCRSSSRSPSTGCPWCGPTRATG